MNILIVGHGIEDKLFCDFLKKSKYCDKIYTAFNNAINEFPNINYSDFNDLAKKSLTLKIDVTFVNDTKLMEKGIAESFYAHHASIVCANKKWVNLETYPIAAKKLMDYYSIKNPKIIKIPAVFPVIVKPEKINGKISGLVAENIPDLIKKREILTVDCGSNKLYVEEFYNGDQISLLSFWDKKNILFFPVYKNLTEVQNDRLELLKTKLSIMYSDEKMDFTGFLNTNILWVDNDWLVINFEMKINPEQIDEVLNKMKQDFLYIINSAIYQKLNEIRLQ